jgi:hypothetical protein
MLEELLCSDRVAAGLSAYFPAFLLLRKSCLMLSPRTTSAENGRRKIKPKSHRIPIRGTRKESQKSKVHAETEAK